MKPSTPELVAYGSAALAAMRALPAYASRTSEQNKDFWNLRGVVELAILMLDAVDVGSGSLAADRGSGSVQGQVLNASIGQSPQIDRSEPSRIACPGERS